MENLSYYYFIGDAFSRELLELLQADRSVHFVPIFPDDVIPDSSPMKGLIYTPSVHFKEEKLLQQMPPHLKKIAVLDLFHGDSKDFLLSFKHFPPDLVFTPFDLGTHFNNQIRIPSLIQEIYSPSKIANRPNLDFKNICFISQPLQEERDGQFNQHDLIKKFQQIVQKISPESRVFVKPHPRENLLFHQDYQLAEGTIPDVLSSFHFFVGYNSALLYAAEGLGKQVFKMTGPNDLNESSIKEFLSKSQVQDTLKQQKISPSSLLIQKLTKLSSTPQIIENYLSILDQAQKNYSSRDWYKTHLANKHRFETCTEQLLKLLHEGPTDLKPFPSPLSVMKRSLAFLLKFGIELYWIKKKERKNLKMLKTLNQINVLKTFSYGHSFKDKKFTDAFLGQLRQYLDQKQQTTVTIFEHLGTIESYREHQVTGQLLINLYSFISWKYYFEQFFILIKNALVLSKKSPDIIRQFIHQNYMIESISPHFFLHEMQYRAFAHLIKHFSVSKIYSTYENNAWEKMLLMARNDFNLSVKVIAHQHVPIAPSALNYYLTPTDLSLLPNKIVTIGVPLKNFLLSLNYPPEILSPGCALRLKLHQYPLPKNGQKLSLVALDGIPQASVVLNTILKHAKFFSDLNWKFVVRFHPLFGYDKMRPYLLDSLEPYPFFEISKSSLEEDLQKTDTVFYWGSTVAFEAMFSGRIVIHTPGNEILSNDPITLEDGLHFTATDITNTIESVLKMSDEEKNKRTSISISYCGQYFSTPTTETLKSFI